MNAPLNSSLECYVGLGGTGTSEKRPLGLSFPHQAPACLGTARRQTYLGALGLKRSGLKVSGSSKYVSIRPMT